MKHGIYNSIVFLIIIGKGISSYSQNARDINLFNACKVWGMMKYLEPEVYTDKHISWDDTLYKIISKDELSNIDIEEHIIKYHPIEKNIFDNNNSSDSLFPELNSWIDSCKIFNSDDKKYFKNILTFRKIPKNPYLKKEISPNVNDLNFFFHRVNCLINKEALLDFMRLWNLLYYYYTFQTHATKSMDLLLIEYIPRFDTITTTSSLALSYRDFLSNFTDSHINEELCKIGYYSSFQLCYLNNSLIFKRNYPSKDNKNLKNGSICLK